MSSPSVSVQAMTTPSTESSRRNQRPYRYGMILLCVGALINWLGLAENYVEPVRYIGVGCIVAGAVLICAAMCCWLQRTPSDQDIESQNSEDGHQIHIIEVPESAFQSPQQKPPDYETVAGPPPCYEDAIKLNPSLLLSPTSAMSENSCPSTPGTEHTSLPFSYQGASSVETSRSPSLTMPSLVDRLNNSEAVSLDGFQRSQIARLQRQRMAFSGVVRTPRTPPPPYPTQR